MTLSSLRIGITGKIEKACNASLLVGADRHSAVIATVHRDSPPILGSAIKRADYLDALQDTGQRTGRFLASFAA